MLALESDDGRASDDLLSVDLSDFSDSSDFSPLPPDVARALIFG